MHFCLNLKSFEIFMKLIVQISIVNITRPSCWERYVILCHSKINNASTNLFVLSKHVILYSLQDPTELSKFNLADFYHLKKGLKVLDEGNKTTLNDHY